MNITPNNGQIRRGSDNAEKLYQLVKQPEVKTIIDIGTWKGMGTTKCVLDGIIDSNKKDYIVYSIECNKVFYEEAKINLGVLPKNFNLINGTLFDSKELYKWRSDASLSNTAKSWLEDDIRNMDKCENVFHLLPESIDLLIIDGGEFSGEIEFNLLWKRSKYLFLDDTTSTKNKNNREYILSHPEIFKVMDDDLLTRFLICENLIWKK